MIQAENIQELLAAMHQCRASDLYLTYGSAPAFRVHDRIELSQYAPLTDADIQRYLTQMLNEEQRYELQTALEINLAISGESNARYRINAFYQQAHAGLVIRRIQTEIPTLDELQLPNSYGELALLKRGLILVAGPTGSGKSTSLAAMVGHRNSLGDGHIITVEDPIEFVHNHNRCIVTQRDVGLDTASYSMALKNALRQRPDMVVIGEVRDREVMEQAIYFAETSHLCVATIHANNSSQAIERILNFFPEERHAQILVNLSHNLKAVLSQRLVNNLQGGKTLALEIMLNRGLIRQLIEEGKTRQIREMIEKGTGEGMMTFDQSLLQLFKAKQISEETAIAESDSPANIKLQLSQSKRESGNVISNMMVRQGSNIRAGETNF